VVARAWRAGALVAVLGGAVVAGAFLLPRGAEGEVDAPLAAAARRTLDEPHYRLTLRTRGEARALVEDYEAPDRFRSRFGFEGSETVSETIVIGHTMYAGWQCSTPTETQSGYQRRTVSTPPLGTGTALLLEAEHARDAVELRPGTHHFTFRYEIPAKYRKRIHLSPVQVDAHVHRGRVDRFVVRATENHQASTSRATFSFGPVPAITAPEGPPIDSDICGVSFIPD
jgi:hypothetical protein